MHRRLGFSGRVAGLVLLGLSSVAQAHGPLPMSLIDVPLPPVPGLLDGDAPIVVDRARAIQLGKALFWDTAVGSDGIACASCHFHAGADRRVKNQLSPGHPAGQASANGFSVLGSGKGGPNHTLRRADFPTYRFADPLRPGQQPTAATDDVVASSGSFGGALVATARTGTVNDECTRAVDPVFHAGSVGARRVEPRNAPTVINAVFNHRNFWDGRANNIFNGSSPWGERDPQAGVWVKVDARNVVRERLHLPNSSLASLAVAPPLDSTEMSCAGRDWASIGRKLLLRQPLQFQRVHPADSVLGPLSRSAAGVLRPGLNTTYRALITQAFHPRFWSFAPRGSFGAPAGGTPYTQIEANFALFFGIALQLYQSTLVSDQAPIDLSNRDSSHRATFVNLPYTSEERAAILRGRDAFANNHCPICHAGPLLTTAALDTNSRLVTPTPGKAYGPSHARIPYGPNALGKVGGPGAAAAGINRHVNLVQRDDTASGPRLHDFGFANTAVADPRNDPGLAGRDPFGNPLSFVDQYLAYLAGDTAAVLDPGVAQTRSCDFLQPLAYNEAVVDPVTFTTVDGIEADGTRESVLRNQDCLADENFGAGMTAFIPTVAATRAAAGTPKLASATGAAFKIPGLRNVELTGPYMHTGGMATLSEVLEFYARHGNVDNPLKHGMVNGVSVGTQPARIPDLIAFLRTFTDERVRHARAPFDHPEISIPHGHVGSVNAAVAGNVLGGLLARDEWFTLPAVGADGAPQALSPFDSYLEP